MRAATLGKDSNVAGVLYLALELSEKTWKLAMTVGLGQAARLRSIAAGDVGRLLRELAVGRQRFGLGEGARVVSCYEAGRDGFWLHRFLLSEGIESLVVDAGSLEVSRRRRRAKTDRLDAEKLVRLLVRYVEGERTVWSVVRVPSVEEEDRRQLHRELEVLQRSATAQVNRIKGLLAGFGVRVGGRGWRRRLGEVRQWDGSPLPPGLRARLGREVARLEFIAAQIRELRAERERLVRESEEAAMVKVRRLKELKGVGLVGAWVLTMEMFGWRQFDNGKQVGSLAGFAPTPYQSGDLARERGINKAGITRVRRVAVQMAWMWRRYQPRSHLALWYQERFAAGSPRQRKVGIVALARKLLLALWRYVEFGIVPEGAELKVQA